MTDYQTLLPLDCWHQIFINLDDLVILRLKPVSNFFEQLRKHTIFNSIKDIRRHIQEVITYNRNYCESYDICKNMDIRSITISCPYSLVINSHIICIELAFFDKCDYCISRMFFSNQNYSDNCKQICIPVYKNAYVNIVI